MSQDMQLLLHKTWATFVRPTLNLNMRWIKPQNIFASKFFLKCKFNDETNWVNFVTPQEGCHYVSHQQVQTLQKTRIVPKPRTFWTLLLIF